MRLEIFDIMHLDKYAIIEEPGTLLIKNNSILDYTNLYEEDEHPRWLLNLKAISRDNLEEIKKMCKNNQVVYYWQISHLLTVGAIWKDQVLDELDLPVKGEYVIASFDYVKDRLLCTNITIIPKVQPELYNPSTEVLKELQELDDIITNLK